MPYVPGHSHDLFLSYARRESEWVDDFRARLERRLYDRLGRKVDFGRILRISLSVKTGLRIFRP